MRRRRRQSGVTLVEMVVVVAIVGIMAGLATPAVTTGLDALRLRAASSEVVGFFNDGLNRAAVRQQLVAVTISPTDRMLKLESSERGFERTLVLPRGISIVRILPESDAAKDAPRQFVLYPGGAVPRVGVEIVNARDVHRIVRVDPITGVPQVEEVASE